MVATAKEWPRSKRDLQSNWRKQIMHERKSILSMSQLKPSSALKRKAIERLKLS